MSVTGGDGRWAILTRMAYRLAARQ